ncbi:hypothetical protein [Virgifigura deserti]|uniref:hypothetical protein n=1 Tax=Virgifigura deserti TaxID=2268457 RepID=UPI003CCC1D35
MSSHQMREDAAPRPSLFITASGTALLLSLGLALGSAAAAEQDKQALIEEALSAAPPQVAETAKIMDWDGTVLKEGSEDFTCLPTPPPARSRGVAPMCLDAAWMAWLDAYKEKREDYRPSEAGVAYMLAGDAGASNIDPFATGQTPDNEWVVEGPHIMLLLPDPAQLDALSADAHGAPGPYVMWKGTPYAHVMVPTAERPAPETAEQQ